MEIKRRPFQGVLNILSFNRHFYVIGIGLLLLIAGSYWMIGWSGFWFAIVVGAFVYGLVMPLLVSAYVYDFSGYYHFQWLDGCSVSDSNTQQIVNINAGFDETSFILKNYFPRSDIQVFDFYDSHRHTEPAIVRARKVSLVYPNTQSISTALIPMADGSVDLVFLLSAVHEIRTHEERVQFLKECFRIGKPSVKVIMVEHLRDFPNFVAFTVGFTHFFSRRSWELAFSEAGFMSFQEKKFTPFMSIFICSPL